MRSVKNITILGTSHIAETSIEEIRRAFQNLNPDIIAVELDKGRLHALMHGEKPSYSPRLIWSIGVSGYLFAIIGGLIQRKLGDVVGMKPGSEMLSAALLARDNHKKIALVDRDVRITLKRVSEEFSFKEKMRLLIDILLSPFSKKLKLDLRNVPEREVVKKLILLLKERYPGLYKAILEERNEYMANKLAIICDNHPGEKILLVVGAGHEDGLFQILSSRL